MLPLDSLVTLNYFGSFRTFYRNITAYYSVFLAILFLFSYTLRGRQYGWERGGGCGRFSTSLPTLQLKFTLHLYFQLQNTTVYFLKPSFQLAILWKLLSFLHATVNSNLSLQPVVWISKAVSPAVWRTTSKHELHRFY